MDLSHWTGVPRPERIVLDGRYTRLEPLGPVHHGGDLLASAQVSGAEDRFRYLFEEPPADLEALMPWLAKAPSRPIRCSSPSSTGEQVGRKAVSPSCG